MNPILEEEKRRLKRLDICYDILKYAKNELYLRMRFLDVALNSLAPVPEPSVSGVAVDGRRLLFLPEALVAMYKESRVTVNRAVLHMLFHCLFADRKSVV